MQHNLKGKNTCTSAEQQLSFVLALRCQHQGTGSGHLERAPRKGDRKQTTRCHRGALDS
jgi:hypothetical protein